MASVILVMRKRGNVKVLAKALGGHGYDVASAMDEEELATRLHAPPRPDAALVDVTGYDEEVWTMCRSLQRAKVPFLVVSGPRQRTLGHQGLEVGAASILQKPLVKSSLLRLLEGLTAR